MNQTKYLFGSKIDDESIIRQCVNSVNKPVREETIGRIRKLAKMLQSGQIPKELETIIQKIREDLNTWPSEKPYYQTILRGYPIIAKKDEELIKQGLIPKLYELKRGR